MSWLAATSIIVIITLVGWVVVAQTAHNRRMRRWRRRTDLTSGAKGPVASSPMDGTRPVTVPSLLSPFYGEVLSAADRWADIDDVTTAVDRVLATHLARVVATADPSRERRAYTVDRFDDSINSRLSLVRTLSDNLPTRRSNWLAEATILLLEAAVDRALLASADPLRLISTGGWVFDILATAEPTERYHWDWPPQAVHPSGRSRRALGERYVEALLGEASTRVALRYRISSRLADTDRDALSRSDLKIDDSDVEATDNAPRSELLSVQPAQAESIADPVATDQHDTSGDVQSVRVFHVSDLHLIEDLFTHGGRWFSPTKGMASHSRDRAEQLARTLELERSDSDVLVVTGDLTTDGSVGALSSAEKYLSKQSVRAPTGQYPTLKCLDWERSRRVLTPGNHDRFGGRAIGFQRESKDFERLLALPDEYPYVRVYEPPQAPDLALAFFVLNSCPAGELKDKYGRRKMSALIAGGYVPTQACTGLLAEAKNLYNTGEAVDLAGNPTNISGKSVVRIAVLHHHPVPNPDGADGPLVRLKHRVFPETLAGRERLIAHLMRAGIQLVLFGHKHQSFVTRQATPVEFQTSQYAYSIQQELLFVCSPSATQYKTSRSAGFLDLRVSASQVRIRLWELTDDIFNFAPATSTTTIDLRP